MRPLRWVLINFGNSKRHGHVLPVLGTPGHIAPGALVRATVPCPIRSLCIHDHSRYPCCAGDCRPHKRTALLALAELVFKEVARASRIADYFSIAMMFRRFPVASPGPVGFTGPGDATGNLQNIMAMLKYSAILDALATSLKTNSAKASSAPLTELSEVHTPRSQVHMSLNILFNRTPSESSPRGCD